MSISVKDTTWKDGTPYINVSGTWKPVTAISENSSGTWKAAYTYVPPATNETLSFSDDMTDWSDATYS